MISKNEKIDNDRYFEHKKQLQEEYKDLFTELTEKEEDEVKSTLDMKHLQEYSSNLEKDFHRGEIDEFKMRKTENY